jgi:hypothetical protein
MPCAVKMGSVSMWGELVQLLFWPIFSHLKSMLQSFRLFETKKTERGIMGTWFLLQNPYKIYWNLQCFVMARGPKPRFYSKNHLR